MSTTPPDGDRLFRLCPSRWVATVRGGLRHTIEADGRARYRASSVHADHIVGHAHEPRSQRALAATLLPRCQSDNEHIMHQVLCCLERYPVPPACAAHSSRNHRHEGEERQGRIGRLGHGRRARLAGYVMIPTRGLGGWPTYAARTRTSAASPNPPTVVFRGRTPGGCPALLQPRRAEVHPMIAPARSVVHHLLGLSPPRSRSTSRTRASASRTR
jgi:hypothetical protein